MKLNWWMVGIAFAFILGFAMGTGVGMQKGQYMLFEGLDGIFEGAEINIDLNETIMVDRMTENLIPLFNETLENSPKTRIETFYIHPYSQANIYEGGLVTCKEMINYTWTDHVGESWDVVLNPTDEIIDCNYRRITH